MSSAPAARPRVGIVVRTRDRPLFVARALQAVLGQTSTDWALALVNDGGDAKPLNAAIEDAGLQGAFDDGRMTLMSLPRSIGRSAAFNHGARALDTQFVCCLDDDDTWDPGFVENLLAFHDQTRPLAPDLGGVACLVTAIREDIITQADGTQAIVVQGTDTLPHAFRRDDFFLNPIAYATYRHDLYPVQWMLDREAVLKAGGFPVDFSVMEDRAFMARFLQTWRVAILDQHLAFHHRRVRRSGDTTQTVDMNTLDNPSYDWRLYSDLARIAVNTPPQGPGDQPISAALAGDLIRASATTIVKELNDETSALWHKLNGEAMSLRARIDTLDARLGAVDPVEDIQTAPDDREWSLWDQVGERDQGFPLSVKSPFLDRFTLSMAQDQDGLLFHASVSQRRAVVQIPATHNFAALEFSLAGLADRHGGLKVEFIIGAADGFLFQTALSLWVRDLLGRKSHVFEQSHVHSCQPGGAIRIQRIFPADLLARTDAPKLSIILPRQARNFRLRCHDLVVSRF